MKFVRNTHLHIKGKLCRETNATKMNGEQTSKVVFHRKNTKSFQPTELLSSAVEKY